MFNKILIANRGEIACRVARTARLLGVKTVAVYSDADANALHVQMADDAFRIGPPAVAESYLNVEAIIAGARASGAEAIHPGYGFLSENPSFVEAVEAAGITFIGPTAEAIRAMGLKDAAKALMVESGVPIVPGYHGDSDEPAELAAHARRIGYPVLIKARAGGGGKGMRRVDSPEDFVTALESAQREAKSAFGDSRCLIEKYILKSRHIEIQIFGDRHGNVVHLFERDCSLQRRHQKVIEESPAPGMSADMRKKMGEVAVAAAKAIRYSGAGTIEFIADVSEGLREDRFYFMEMNTRLQVEHPVTESVTGHDLVEWQLRVASGEALPVSQNELSLSGWSFEARLYAEDATKGFLPATGTLRRLSLPDHIARIDAGVREGDEITPFYDPMIAKLIVHGSSRDHALRLLTSALAQCRVGGSVTNAAFLCNLVRDPCFMRGDVDTGLIERNLTELLAAPVPDAEITAIAAIGLLGLLAQDEQSDPWAALSGFRLWDGVPLHLQLAQGGRIDEVSVTARGHGAFSVETSKGMVDLNGVICNKDEVRVNCGGRTVSVYLLLDGRHASLFTEGRTFDFESLDADDKADDADATGDNLYSPMPGLVCRIHVRAGQTVRRGDPMVIIDAMKMEHTLIAPRDGTVSDVFVKAGEHVQDGVMLLTLEANR
jgi:3-methylcrotonyl-CoA carboxylase alpha subunit